MNSDIILAFVVDMNNKSGSFVGINCWTRKLAIHSENFF